MNRDMRQDLDRAMSGVAVDGACRAAILGAVEKGEKPMKKVVRPAVVLAAVLAALTISALALSPAVQNMLTEALGDYTKYTQNVEGVTAVDQGIEISVVSAMTDASSTKVYLSVKDLTGDRLGNGELAIDGVLSRPDTELAVWSGGCKFLSYDAESRTALFVMEHSGSLIANGNAKVAVGVGKIRPGNTNFYDIQLPQELVSDKLLQTQKLTTGETVLKPGQTNYKFEGVDYMSLSSMGFASDGKFHILLSLPADREVYGAILTNIWSKSDDKSWIYNEDLDTLDFTLGKEHYYELTFAVSAKHWADIKLDTLYGGFVNPGKIIEGKWVMQAELEQLPQRRFEINETINSLTEHTLLLSPMSVVMTGDKPGDHGSLQASALFAVWMKDGTVLFPKNRGSMWTNVEEGDRSMDRWEFEQPVDVAEIVGVSVYYWYIPVSGDTAGPGYWLKELPQKD